jgi:hypothetical protein
MDMMFDQRVQVRAGLLLLLLLLLLLHICCNVK